VALHSYAGISLDETNEIARLQTRIDRKYLIDPSTLLDLLGHLTSTSRVLEIDARRACNYRSTYFDTPDLALYRAAAQGRRHRFKVRSRAYGDAGPAFLEVKAKGRRGVNEKSRIPYGRSDLRSITSQGTDFIAALTGDQQLARRLTPVLTSAYLRTTLVEVSERSRVTVDCGLRCAAELGGVALGEVALNGIVIETKSERGASAADRWLQERRIRPAKISKFCTGLAALHPELPSNKWRRVVDRHWTAQSLPASQGSVTWS